MALNITKWINLDRDNFRACELPDADNSIYVTLSAGKTGKVFYIHKLATIRDLRWFLELGKTKRDS